MSANKPAPADTFFYFILFIYFYFFGNCQGCRAHPVNREIYLFGYSEYELLIL